MPGDVPEPGHLAPPVITARGASGGTRQSRGECIDRRRKRCSLRPLYPGAARALRGSAAGRQSLPRRDATAEHSPPWPRSRCRRWVRVPTPSNERRQDGDLEPKSWEYTVLIWDGEAPTRAASSASATAAPGPHRRRRYLPTLRELGDEGFELVTHQFLVPGNTTAAGVTASPPRLHDLQTPAGRGVRRKVSLFHGRHRGREAHLADGPGDNQGHAGVNRVSRGPVQALHEGLLQRICRAGGDGGLDGGDIHDAAPAGPDAEHPVAIGADIDGAVRQELDM